MLPDSHDQLKLTDIYIYLNGCWMAAGWIKNSVSTRGTSDLIVMQGDAGRVAMGDGDGDGK